MKELKLESLKHLWTVSMSICFEFENFLYLDSVYNHFNFLTAFLLKTFSYWDLFCRAGQKQILSVNPPSLYFELTRNIALQTFKSGWKRTRMEMSEENNLAAFWNGTKKHFMSIENGIFDPKDINRLDCMMGIGIERDRCMISTTKKIQSSSCHCRWVQQGCRQPGPICPSETPLRPFQIHEPE